MKIKSVRVHHIDRSLWGHLAEREETLPLTTPMDIYAEFQETRGSWFWDEGLAVVRIETNDGAFGTGWCEDGCRAIAPIIEHHLSRILVGASPFEVEGLFDRLYRVTIPYGRTGVAMQAISAIDIALWDLMGHATGKPVYELLGGPVRSRVPVYASALHPVKPEQVQQEATAYVEQGFRAMKMRPKYGPLHGREGMIKNEEHVRNVRETVGDGIALMLDAYMGWDFHYAVQMCRRLEKYDLNWLEEPFLPDDLKSYAKLRKETAIPISGGEHEFSVYGYEKVIDYEAMDIIQPDLRRCGGLTAGRKIAAMAAAAGLTVIPHAYGIVHLHYALATPVVPMAEYFPMPVWEDTSRLNMQPVFVGEPTPEAGSVSLASTPGLTVTVNDELL